MGFLDSIFGNTQNASKNNHPKSTPSGDVVVDANSVTFSAPTGRFFKDASSLLRQNDQIVFSVKQIKEIAGLSDDQFDKYYLPTMQHFAELVQDIGASHNHHHSYPYGLLEHSLQVAEYAMNRAQGGCYFASGKPETKDWLKHVFMYTVFVAALLHDAGKALTNVRWYVRGDSKSKWQLWSPLVHALPSEADCIEYKTTSFSNKEGVNVYTQRSHEIMTASVITSLIPVDGLQWIIEDSEKYFPELYMHLIHALGADYDNAEQIGECVRAADQLSTAEGVKRLHAMNGGGRFVDLDDPNLPLHESYREVFAKMFANPDGYELVTNKMAMGKYSHIERVGDLIFVSAKGVLPKVNKVLKDTNVKIGKDQTVYTLLADNAVTLKAPSDDTLWWAEFYSPNNPNHCKENSYLVFDANQFGDVNIDDVRSYDVRCILSAKSLPEECDELTPEEFPEIYGLMNDPDFELKVKPKAAENGNAQVDSGSETPLEDDVDSESPNETLPEQATVSTDASPKAEQEKTHSSTTLTPPKPRQTLTPPAAKPTENSEPKAAASSETKSSTSSNTKSKNTTSRKPAAKKSSQNATGGNLLDKAASIGLGMSSAPQDVATKNNPDLRSPVKMIDNEPEVTSDSEPVFGHVKIVTPPTEIDMDDAVLNSLLLRNPTQNAPGFDVVESENSVESTRSLLTLWFPYLSQLTDTGAINLTSADSMVFHMSEGSFFVKSRIEATFCAELAKEICAALSTSSFTLSKSGACELECMTTDGEVLVGYLIGGYRQLRNQGAVLTRRTDLRIL